MADVSAEQVIKVAEPIAKKSGVDDDAIKSSENLLLTFTKVRNEAGRGNDVFNQTTQAAEDMAVALGTDGKTAALNSARR